MKKWILLVFTIIFLSCNNNVDSDCTLQGGAILELNIPDTLQINQEYKIDITYGAPNLCYRFEGITTEFQNNNLIINARICNKQKTNNECPQSPLYGTTTNSIVFTEIGVFKLLINEDKFYKNVWVRK